MTNTRSAAQTAVRTAIDSGRVPSFEPTGVGPVDALLTCADALGIRVGHIRIGAAARMRPGTAEPAARALGLAVRPVDLIPSQRWWAEGAEPLVAHCRDGSWVALVPTAGGLARIGPDGDTSVVSEADADELEPQAWALIRTFSDDTQGMAELGRVAWPTGTGRDLAALGAIGLFSMLISTLVPILSGQIVGQLVPTGEIGRILVLTVILVLAAALSAVTLSASSIVAQRFTTRSSLRVTAAAYERIFRLRTAFHREHQPGELAERISGIESFRAGVASATPAVVSAVGTIVASILVLGRVSAALALAVLVMSVLVLGGGALALPRLLRDARAYTETSLELSGLTFSMLGGIAKIRSAGAEQRMLDRWMFRFAHQQRAVRQLNIRTMVLGLLATIPASLVPILLVLGEISGTAVMPIGEFTTATAAAAQAAGALAGLLPVAVTLVSLTPLVRALRPILEAEPEPRGSAANDPGELAGDISLDHVTFGYDPETPVLVDISLEVPAGTMTAIVGASGSGKSSIIKLLLGLECPQAGTVLFDGTALSSLDRAAVLAQMGIVPQDAALVPGSILENILVAAPDLDEDAAWSAAEQAQIADDIRAMPMGMQTMVSGGASTFSGGQRQRLMIARALVREPRILVLDEATSALDNPTQERVAASIAGVGATRIVVAHRLTTIRQADQIVVLDAGRIVEVGTYDELVDAGGMFARLATRQV